MFWILYTLLFLAAATVLAITLGTLIKMINDAHDEIDTLEAENFELKQTIIMNA